MIADDDDDDYYYYSNEAVDRNDRADQMGRILLRRFLYHEYSVDERVEHDQHHRNPRKRSLPREDCEGQLTS